VLLCVCDTVCVCEYVCVCVCLHFFIQVKFVKINQGDNLFSKDTVE
jgi:hypothetical protein